MPHSSEYFANKTEIQQKREVDTAKQSVESENVSRKKKIVYS